MKPHQLLFASACSCGLALGRKYRRPLHALACSGVLALAGCGFHPRGELVVPEGIGPVKVVAADPYNQLGEKLSRTLSRAHALAATDPEARTATLRIVSEAWDQQPLTINLHAQATEYYITYVVRFSFAAADGKAIAPVLEARLQRDFQYTVTHALGSAQEQDTIHDEMRRDMAATIIRQIGVALRQYQP